MGAFGERLRRERETRGISLEQIVATTKIGTRLLRALEDEQFDLLPGGIFNKSYVRAYAKCVGMDEDEAVAAYLQAANEAPPDTRVIAQQHASFHTDRPRERTGFPIVPVLILLVVIAGAVGGWKVYQDRQRERPQPNIATGAAPQLPVAATGTGTAPSPNAGGPPAALPDSSAAKPPAPVAASSASSPNTAVVQNPPPSRAEKAGNSASDGSFELVVRAKGPAWVSIKSDDQIAVRGIIKPPDVKTVRAKDEVVFYTGNAGAVEVSFNGKNVPLKGGPNEEQVLVFDSKGIVPRAPAK